MNLNLSVFIQIYSLYIYVCVLFICIKIILSATLFNNLLDGAATAQLVNS